MIEISIEKQGKKDIVKIKTPLKPPQAISIMTEAMGMLIRYLPKNEWGNEIGRIKKHLKAVIKDDSYMTL
jgi:hypothetical protein